MHGLRRRRSSIYKPFLRLASSCTHALKLELSRSLVLEVETWMSRRCKGDEPGLACCLSLRPARSLSPVWRVSAPIHRNFTNAIEVVCRTRLWIQKRLWQQGISFLTEGNGMETCLHVEATEAACAVMSGLLLITRARCMPQGQITWDGDCPSQLLDPGVDLPYELALRLVPCALTMLAGLIFPESGVGMPNLLDCIYRGGRSFKLVTARCSVLCVDMPGYRARTTAESAERSVHENRPRCWASACSSVYSNCRRIISNWRACRIL